MRLSDLLLTAVISISPVLTAENSSFTVCDVYSRKAGPMFLDEQFYSDVTTGSRDYYTAILFTALDQKYACYDCWDFQSEWEIFGKCWQKGGKLADTRLVLGALDFDQGRDAFLKVRYSGSG